MHYWSERSSRTEIRGKRIRVTTSLYCDIFKNSNVYELFITSNPYLFSFFQSVEKNYFSFGIYCVLHDFICFLWRLEKLKYFRSHFKKFILRIKIFFIKYEFQWPKIDQRLLLTPFKGIVISSFNAFFFWKQSYFRTKLCC